VAVVLRDHLEWQPVTAPNIDCPGMDAIKGTPNPPTPRPETGSDQQIGHRHMPVNTKKLPSRPCALTADHGHWHVSVPHIDYDLGANA